ncbi:MAG: PD-(D/E)XK nuclease family protein [Sulfuriferula sp.]|nr:PD-(D/E)XK nuclease family protein [Sulfuriferula sp.]
MLAAFFQRAAQRILRECAVQQTELADAVILVPNFQAGAALARALVEASGLAVLVSPQILTFPAWAQTLSPAVAVLPNSRRLTQLYHILKERNWFDQALLWGMCDEIARLFDELTYQAVDLPVDVGQFTAQLQAYYRSHRHRAIEFEAQLVHELWFALSQDGQSPAAQYALQLAQLAEAAAVPLFVVGLPQLTRLEQHCLQRYALRQRVTHIDIDSVDVVAQTLAAAWPQNLETPLLQRAQDLAANIVDSPLSGRLHYCAAYSLEEEAVAADTQVRLWLHEGRQRIAVVVQDRISARRLRALLERAQILVSDETGWTLDTTAASTVVMRWVEALLADFPYRDVLDLIKSPYLFPDWDALQRKQAAWQIEHALRSHGPVDGCAGLIAVLQRQSDNADALAAVSRLQAALGIVQIASLSDWLDRLDHSLIALGARTRLADDAAGQQLLGLLARRRHELADDRGSFTLAEFHRWLGRELEQGAFIDQRVNSPVVFTHLAATRLRMFDAALILGADASHLPSLSSHAVFFNQQVRAALGLSTPALEMAQIQADLMQLLIAVPAVCVLWQARSEGEINAISPWLERLDSLHSLAWGTGLLDNGLREICGAAQIATPDRAVSPTPSDMPQPALMPDLVPKRISVSAYNTLLACPYQYFSRHVLGLNELDEISAEIEKSDYGQAVHAILKTFHERYPAVAAVSYDMAVQALQEISEQAFAPMLHDDYYARAWQQQWLEKIPAYLDWQLQREQEGWLWHEGEVTKQLELLLDDGRSIQLYGRLDRVDRIADSHAVLDYKTGSSKGLKDKAEHFDEDVQLAAYALLMQSEVGQAAFVSLDGGKVTTIPLNTEPQAAAEDSAARLTMLFTQLYRQAPLPANGIDNVCQYCDMRGLCRRDFWVDTALAAI